MVISGPQFTRKNAGGSKWQQPMATPLFTKTEDTLVLLLTEGWVWSVLALAWQDVSAHGGCQIVT